FCSGWLPSADNPSMVVTDLPATSDSGIEHERTASPSICTVQAPQAAMPQPNLVPVSLRCSRNTQSSGVSGAASTSCRCPLTVKATIGLLPGLDVHALAARERPLLLFSSPVGDAALSRKSGASDSRFPTCRQMPAGRRHHRPL